MLQQEGLKLVFAMVLLCWCNLFIPLTLRKHWGMLFDMFLL